jgi:transcriptional regulator with XRE-family HTH domain
MSATQNAKKSKASRSTGKTRAKVSSRVAAVEKSKNTSADVKALRNRFGLKQVQMSRLLGISARKLSELESDLGEPRPETLRRVTEVDRLRKALDEIMDASDIAAWMEKSNEAFGGSTPLQLVERGEIDRLWQMIFAIRTGHPM